MKRLSLVVLLLFIPLLAGAKGQVDYVSDTGFIVSNKFSSNIKAPDIWRALTEEIDQWWPKDHTWWGEQGILAIEPVAGGCFCETAGRRSAQHMQISFVEPYKLLRMTGGLGPLQGMGMHGALDWQLVQKEDVTEVTLTYRVSGIHPDGFKQLAAIVAQVQGIQLQALKTYVEKGGDQ
jgi:uncharacterized protein YndB with AHSA1/START domain